MAPRGSQGYEPGRTPDLEKVLDWMLLLASWTLSLAPGRLSLLVDYSLNRLILSSTLPQILTSAFRSVGPPLVINSPVAFTWLPYLLHARNTAPIPPNFQEFPFKPGASVFPCGRLRTREIYDPHPGHFICEETTPSQGAQGSRVEAVA